MNEIFGSHLTLDCHRCNKGKLDDLQHIFEVLSTLPNLIGMTKITQPYVFPYNGLVPEDKGITGVVIIAESHISIHTFSEKDYLFCDVFSCKPFDVEVAIDYIKTSFGVQDCKINVLQRGVGFPR